MTRLQALEQEISDRMDSLSSLAARAESGENVGQLALPLMDEVQELYTEVTVERARTSTDVLNA